jgi:hypothetical protein
MAEKNTPKSPKRSGRGSDLPPPDDEQNLPERWHPRRRGFWGNLTRFVFFTTLLLALVLPFTPYAGKIKRSLIEIVEKARSGKVVVRDVTKEVPVYKEKTVEKIVEVEVPAPPPPLPSKFVARKEVDAATLFNGLTIQTTLQTEEGKYASIERTDKDAYTVDFQLKIRIPKPNESLDELARINPELPKALPGLKSMLDNNAKVSGFYHKLYERKASMVQQNLTRLNKILDRHNFFDCETILELTHPVSKRNVLLIQSEMDVVADGSDGDRMPVMSADIYNSDYYQPFTTYEWAKKSSTTNPLLPRWQGRFESAKAEYGKKGISNAKKAEFKSEMDEADRIVKALKSRSSLIAEKDPFIVISLLFRDYPKVHPHAPSIGDYAAIIHGNQILPAICGDYGPTMKMGEASLMVAKKINDKSTPYNRPESDLKVTYLIFPGTAERPFGPPDLQKWREKVNAYLTDVGGVGDGYVLHTWENPFPAPATVTPPPPATTLPATPPLATTPPGTTPPAATSSPVPVSPASSTPTPVSPPASPVSAPLKPAETVIPATKSTPAS